MYVCRGPRYPFQPDAPGTRLSVNDVAEIAVDAENAGEEPEKWGGVLDRVEFAATMAELQAAREQLVGGEDAE